MKYDKQILDAAIRALIAGCRGETDHEFEFESKKPTNGNDHNTKERNSENEEN